MNCSRKYLMSLKPVFKAASLTLQLVLIINSAALRFVHRDAMEAEGYGAYLDQVEERR